MAVRVEKEIQKLLRQHKDIQNLGQELVAWAEKQYVLNKEDIESLANFLLKNELHKTLMDWLGKNISNPKFEIPWPQMLESIGLSHKDVPADFVTDLREGMREQQSFLESAKSRAFDENWEDLARWRERIPQKLTQDLQAKKDQMLFQISTFRTAHLPAQEKQLLLRLLKLFPSDHAVKSAFQDHRERYALDIVNRAKDKRHLNLNPLSSAEDLQLQKSVAASVLEIAKANPELGVDLCIAAVSMEDYELAWSCLSLAPASKAKDWIAPELLLKLGRHLELIEYLKHLETHHPDDSDCFFATAYFRAQALYGLGNKNMAIEVLEALIDSNPEYRSATALLREWRQN